MLLHGKISRKARIIFFHLGIIDRRLVQMQEQVKRCGRKFFHLKSRCRRIQNRLGTRAYSINFQTYFSQKRSYSTNQKKKKKKNNVILPFFDLFLHQQQSGCIVMDMWILSVQECSAGIRRGKLTVIICFG